MNQKVAAFTPSNMPGRYEEATLVSLVRLPCPASARQIRLDIEAHIESEVSISVLYAALDRLEKKGFLTSTIEGPTGTKGERPKRLFSLTRKGKDLLRHTEQMSQRIWHGVPAQAVHA